MYKIGTQAKCTKRFILVVFQYVFLVFTTSSMLAIRRTSRF